MLYLVYLRDIENNAPIRSRLLDAHMQHIGGYIDSIRLGGPLLRDGSDGQAGGILIVESESSEAVRDMLEADPYYQAGLWDEVRIQPFKEIINAWR